MKKHIEPLNSLQVKPDGVYTCVLKRPSSKRIGGVNFRDSISPPVSGSTALAMRGRCLHYILPYTPDLKVVWSKGTEHPPEMYVEVEDAVESKPKRKKRKNNK